MAADRPAFIRGSTFRLSVQSSHPYFVVSDPDRDNARVVIANFTTLAEHKDAPTIARRGEHPCLTADSVIAYARARVVSEAELLAGVRANQIVVSEMPVLGVALLDRLTASFADSDEVPIGVLRVLREQDLLPPPPRDRR